ncbi:7-cyano-7-deazaguanine synthase QueC [Actinoplanes sp. NPDC051411]|uniref:7-cyano-7-deazaguanine synthase QueC n=1 Tax=Actinoplanes sp. NPDC051411 TaxID=3155522 RepID=UPI00344A2365
MTTSTTTGADLFAPTAPIRHAVAVVSGGLDSTTLAYWLRQHTDELTLLSVDYGQRHARELQFAQATAAALGVAHHVVDMTSAGALLGGSALTDAAVDVPDGHYTDASMAATVVPNRNALLLDLAVGLATTIRADAVAFGAHSGDHAIYPDCRPEFLDAYRTMALIAGAGFLVDDFQVLAPFLTVTKTDIVALAARLHVPMENTWSCYRGGDVHCGTCGTCTERREAFTDARVPDPTTYASTAPANPAA